MEVAGIIARIRSDLPVELLLRPGVSSYELMCELFPSGMQSAGPAPRNEISGFWRSVLSEITLGNYRDETPEDLRQLAFSLGIDSLLSRDPRKLSGGETAKLILACHLYTRPAVLLVDGLFDEMDVQSRAVFAGYIRSGKQDSVIVCSGESSLPGEHLQIVTSEPMLVRLTEKAVVPAGAFYRHSLVVEELLSPRCLASPAIGLEVDRLSFSRGDHRVLRTLSISQRAGSVSLLLGPNGAGKTTLLECIAGLLPSDGQIIFRTGSTNSEVHPDIAYSPQDADEDVFEETLVDQLAVSCGDIAVQESLKKLQVPTHYWGQNLNQMPGLKKAASVLSAVLRESGMCLLDEPSLLCTLDQIRWIARAIKCRWEKDQTTLLSTHDERLLTALTLV